MTLRLVNGCAKLALASFLGVAFSWAMPAQAGLPPIWEPNFGSELTDLTGEDDEQTEVSLGFLFPYAGTDYANVFVGINGALQLGVKISTCSSLFSLALSLEDNYVKD